MHAAGSSLKQLNYSSVWEPISKYATMLVLYHWESVMAKCHNHFFQKGVCALEFVLNKSQRQILEVSLFVISTAELMPALFPECGRSLYLQMTSMFRFRCHNRVAVSTVAFVYTLPFTYQQLKRPLDVRLL
jgi:uncharacterized membrane protein YhfC